MRSKKKYSCKGKFNEKKTHARQLKMLMLWPYKNSYKEFDNEEIFQLLEISLPPITFLMVLPIFV